jgi:hypothetical protein
VIVDGGVLGAAWPRFLLVAGALGAACAPALATSPPPLPLWMSGCWQGEGTSSGSTEAWTNGRIGRMLGLGQTLRGSRGSFELMQIASSADGTLVFIAQPGGRPPVSFKATTVEPNRIVFANPAHDEPKTIEYRRDGDRLLAYLDPRPPDPQPSFSFRRTGCDSQFGLPSALPSVPNPPLSK